MIAYPNQDKDDTFFEFEYKINGEDYSDAEKMYNNMFGGDGGETYFTITVLCLVCFLLLCTSTCVVCLKRYCIKMKIEPLQKDRNNEDVDNEYELEEIADGPDTEYNTHRKSER